MYLGRYFLIQHSVYLRREYLKEIVILRYKNRPIMSGPGLFDPTTVMNADVLLKYQREYWIKLAVYLLSFFYYLYGMIYTLISS